MEAISTGLPLYVFDSRPRGERWGYVRLNPFRLHLVLTAEEVAEVVRHGGLRRLRFEGWWEIHGLAGIEAAA